MSKDLSKTVQKLQIVNTNVLDLPVSAAIIYHAFEVPRQKEKHKDATDMIGEMKKWSKEYKFLLANPVQNCYAFLCQCFPNVANIYEDVYIR